MTRAAAAAAAIAAVALAFASPGVVRSASVSRTITYTPGEDRRPDDNDDGDDAAAAAGGNPGSIPRPAALSYSRYPSYPPYCSTPSAMATRSIPPLRPSSDHASYGLQSTKLRHASAVIRHGARTPWSPSIMCWDGYWTDPRTGVWDCALTTVTSPPSPPFVREVEAHPSAAGDAAEAREGDDAMFLFEKRYDALHHPPELANGFNGTCQSGQLLLRGYEQEMANGRHLRDAYVYDGSSGGAAQDERMRLFDLTRPSPRRPYEPPDLHYRVDDQQRTLMSGQVLLRGLFGDLLRSHKQELGEDPVIVAHTADYSRDILAPREKICPRLVDLREEAENSAEFAAFNSSDEAEVLGTMMVETMGRDFMDNAVDCLMTTLCTDRPLPDPIDDYRGELDRFGTGKGKGGATETTETPAAPPPPPPDSSKYDAAYGPHRFARTMDFGVRQWTYPYTYNDAAYSKLGMGPLWKEIVDRMMTVLRPEASKEGGGGNGGEEDGGPTKLALFSGHDTTIMPLLATLGRDVFDGSEWSPYASMVIIEIHEITARTDPAPSAAGGGLSDSFFPSDHAFRLLYNGRVLTSRVGGCPSDLDLCDVSVLLNRVGPFATAERDCARADGGYDGSAMEEAVEGAGAILATPSGALLFLLGAALSAMAGAAGMYAYLVRRLRVGGGPGGGGRGGRGGSRGSSFYGSFYKGSSLGGTKETEGGMTAEEESCSESEWVYGSNEGENENGRNGGGYNEDDRISWQVT
eukprot:CAMPEP_0113539014 /NCGR_PEP_ID=MMETSP0015_2-20120614/7689_1 /TAXON_ID=2838 /ORGANISM="Odontella" /LENGTH=746 /DNA_ID=CAMNT_0000438659 /DNA_START=127 /DNA_END=2367 /DNA_ORIENTATION=+ /assembly_acc=CAM_ASM_000160